LREPSLRALEGPIQNLERPRVGEGQNSNLAQYLKTKETRWKAGCKNCRIEKKGGAASGGRKFAEGRTSVACLDLL